jgi:broad specificity polyphosphatase/5'/3'-nucleotidase SurE
VGALSQCCVSITPLSLDLTSYAFKKELEAWQFNDLKKKDEG